VRPQSVPPQVWAGLLQLVFLLQLITFLDVLGPRVQTLLTDHEVFITDWHSARDVQGPGALQQLAETRLTIKLTVYNYGTAWHLYAWDSFAMRSVVA
jgi:hypothetical protein